jgi:tetratricopeptide (TPR) repeat protein
MKLIKLFILSLLIVTSATAQSLKEAIRYSDREQYQKAKVVLSNLIKNDSKNTDYYYYLGNVYFKNDQYDSARYWFMQGVQMNDQSALNYAGLGKVSMQQDNTVEGKANFDKAVSIAKKDGNVYATIADYYTSLDKPNGKEALGYATKGVEVDPKNSWAKLVLGDAYIAASNEGGSKAIEQYKAASVLDPKSPLPVWKMGKLYVAVKNYELGIQTFNEGLMLDSLFAPIYRDLGELYYRSRKFNNAIASYKKYLTIRDKSDDTDFRYASFLFLNQDYTNALSILNNLAKKNYSNPILYRITAYSQYETKDYTSALQTMDVFWGQIDAKNIISNDYEYYGKILAKKGQDSLAVDYLNKALNRDSTNTDLYSEIVNIWYNSKKYDKAAVALQRKIEATKATAKASTLANDYLTLGRYYLLCKYYSSADSAFANVVLLKPELSIGYLNRARANGNLDPKQEQGLAKPYYEKFIEIAKEDPKKNKKELVEAYSYFGSYYYKKDKVKFDEAWANVRQLDPSNKAGIEATKIKW